MDRVADLPPDLQSALADHDVVVFDGDCVLCSGFFRFVLRADRTARFRFVLAQSELGGRLYRALGLDDRDFETNVVIVGGRIHTRGRAFTAAMRRLGWPWRAAALGDALPRRLADPLYRWIARNRYGIFGRHDLCIVPAGPVAGRFLPGGEKAAAVAA